MFGEIRFNARFVFVVLFAVMLTVTGCGPTKVPVSNGQQARTLAEKLMGDWKSGVKSADLSKQSPPIYVSEDLWAKGVKLTEYKFVGDGEMLGPNVRFKISLKYLEKDGKVNERAFNYLVTTTPALTFFREES